MEQLLLLSKADAKAFAKKIKTAAIAAHEQIEQAGRWLIEFRDQEGWKSLGYDSWTQCIEREFSSVHGGRRRIFKLIENAEVVENIENTDVSHTESTPGSATRGTGIPIRQTQHLSKVPAKKQKEAYQRAVELGNGKPTETTVKKAIEEYFEQVRAAEKIQRDDTGYALPVDVPDIWNRRSEVKELLAEISRARCAVRDAAETEDPLFRPSNVNGALHHLDAAYRSLQISMPYAVCPTCQGRARDTCVFCKGRGLISKFLFDTCVPEELKAVRAKSCVVWISKTIKKGRWDQSKDPDNNGTSPQEATSSRMD